MRSCFETEVEDAIGFWNSGDRRVSPVRVILIIIWCNGIFQLVGSDVGVSDEFYSLVFCCDVNPSDFILVSLDESPAAGVVVSLLYFNCSILSLNDCFKIGYPLTD